MVNQDFKFNACRIVWVLFIILTVPSHSADFSLIYSSTAIPQAHAHNDYNHPRPLLDALHHGFRSIEADIVLFGDGLYVAHTFLGIRTGRTLENLYLKPLHKWIVHGNGRVFSDNTKLLLLIDIKSSAGASYIKLKELLIEYKDIIHVFGEKNQVWKPVLIILSGNRPKKLLETEKIRYAAYDGRSADLHSSVPKSLMPIISEKWSRMFSWRGIGPMPEDERRKLHETVSIAHKAGRLVRFWAAPEGHPEQQEAVWNELIEAGVDLINTDDLKGFREFSLQWMVQSF